MEPFPYATASPAQIEARARSLIGKDLDEIDPSAPLRPSSPQTKGVVGLIFESAFDIPPNSIAGPDFAGAAIELKSVPIHLVRGENKAKERISLGMIDFALLPSETWEGASVRKKLDRLLLIFYAWDPLLPIARFRTLAAGIWRPDEASVAAIRSDWETVRDLVRDGRQGELSESLSRVLGAATKGPGHGSRSRAWSLKQPFVSWLFGTMHGTEEIPRVPISLDPEAAFEAAVLEQLRPHIGRSMAALATTAGRGDLGGKAATAAIVRALIGQPMSGRRGDFERFGIEVKTVPVDARGQILESMSFPAFVHEELVFESWEDSDLLGRLNRMLIVPIHRERKGTLAAARMGRPFFWNPSPTALEGIAGEWETFRHLIEVGEAGRLPPASETRYIHVRPKGRDASDRDVAPGGFDVIKKSFWLNQSYLREVLAENDVLAAPSPR